MRLLLVAFIYRLKLKVYPTDTEMFSFYVLGSTPNTSIMKFSISHYVIQPSILLGLVTEYANLMEVHQIFQHPWGDLCRIDSSMGVHPFVTLTDLAHPWGVLPWVTFSDLIHVVAYNIVITITCINEMMVWNLISLYIFRYQQL